MHRKTYKIAVWKRWDFEVLEAVEDFYARTKTFPDVLLANPTTFAKINIIAAKSVLLSQSRIAKSTGEKPDGTEYVDLTGFVSRDFELRFAESDKLLDTEFALLHGSSPDDDGGIPCPVDDTVADVADKKQQRKLG